MPDVRKDYTVGVLVALTAAAGGGLALLFKWLISKHQDRWSEDERTLPRWTYDTSADSLIVLDALSIPLTVTALGKYLNADRERCPG